MKPSLTVLSVDSLGGLIAGICTLFAAPLLTGWYAWPEGLALFVGAVNVGYGCYSGTLVLYSRRQAQLSRWAVIILIAANSAWALLCFVQVGLLRESASYLGLGHFLFEGVWVGGLAFLEARMVLPFVASTDKAT
jgi:hypothetical protein